MSKSALIVVDVQKDFQEGGALPVQGGLQVAKDIFEYLKTEGSNYDAVIFTRDFHDDNSNNGGHFAVAPNSPDYENTWPRHCVKGTVGAMYADEMRKYLDLALGFSNQGYPPVYELIKGMGEPAYSAFDGKFVGDDSVDWNEFEYIAVCGLAYDYCVSATVLDAKKFTPARVVALASLSASVSRKTEIAATIALTQAGIGIA